MHFIKKKMALVNNLLELDREEFLKESEISENKLTSLVNEAKILLEE